MDESAPENILEATARAMRFYLDVSAEVNYLTLAFSPQTEIELRH